MPMIDPGLIARLRTSVQTGFLTDTCKIEVLSMTTGDLGQPVEAWQTVAASVACRVIGEQQSDTATPGQQETMTDTYRLVCPVGTALDKQQRVTVTSTGHVYDVAGVIDDLSDSVFVTAQIVRRR